MAGPFDVDTVDEFHLRANSATFDFSQVGNVPMRLRMMQAVRVLYAGAPRCAAMMRIIDGINARPGRDIRFFDEVKAALAGTRLPPPGVAGGFSIWINGASADGPGTAVANRREERICIYPSEYGTYAGVLMATWHEMTHIFTTLTHGAFNAATRQYEPPQDPVNVAWAAHIAALKACAPDTGRDPATKTGTAIKNGILWVCNCGTSAARARGAA